MSYDLFWRGEPSLVVAFRKAEEMRNDKLNQQLWLQGLYIYEALCDVSVVIPRVGKKKVKPVPYPDKPYELKTESDKKQEQREKRKMEAMKAKMEAFASRFNRKFAGKKGGNNDGGRSDH